MKARPSSCQANPSDSLPIIDQDRPGPGLLACHMMRRPRRQAVLAEQFLEPRCRLVGAADDRHAVEVSQPFQLLHETGHGPLDGTRAPVPAHQADRFGQPHPEPGRGLRIHAMPGARAEQADVEHGKFESPASNTLLVEIELCGFRQDPAFLDLFRACLFSIFAPCSSISLLISSGSISATRLFVGR